MFFGVLIEISVSAICIILGFLIWKKRRISLLHDYHYRNVKAEDVPVYTKQIGMSLIVIGIGILIAALFDLVHSSLWWIPMFSGFAVGATLIIRAQKRYNGSIMS